jgi:hypothetical protein
MKINGRRHHQQPSTTVCRAHRKNNAPRRNRPVRLDDDLVTPQGRYPGAWATDLAHIFGWDDVLEASGVAAAGGGAAGGEGGGGEVNVITNTNPNDAAAAAPGVDTYSPSRLLLPTRIALDGANIAWSLGTSVRSRFKCRQFPLSAGVVRALEYEPWQQQGRVGTFTYSWQPARAA